MEKQRIVDVHLDMWLHGLIINEAIDPKTNETVDLTNLTIYEIIEKLDNYEIVIPPAQILKHLPTNIRANGVVPSRFTIEDLMKMNPHNYTEDEVNKLNEGRQ